MKKSIYWVLMVIASIVPYATGATISDVQISPEQPSTIDIITIESRGSFSGGTLFYDTSVFTVNELSLQLDLYFTGGSGPQVPQIWQHNDVIGILAGGNYDLLVQAYYRSSGVAEYSLHDEYATEFEVVPEPAALSILGLGFLFIRRRKQAIY